MSRFIREKYRNFESYTPGEQPKDTVYVKLNTNESPFPPAPEVMEAFKNFDCSKLRLYPDPTGRGLKKKLANSFGLEPENIFLSNGSDDILNFSFMAFNDDDDELLFPEISYSFYEVIAGLHGVNFHKVPLKEDMSIDYRDYCGVEMNIAIPNPNAPTGIALPPAEIEEIVRTNPNHVVLIDEAYVDFGAESVVPLVKKYDNLIVSQTFSKSRSLAGGRLGFAVGNAELIDDLAKIQYSTNPYNVNMVTQVLGEASMDAGEYYRKNSEIIQENRNYTTKRLEEMGFSVLPSTANFVFARHEKISGDQIYQKLKENGVLVRHFTTEAIRDYNRITIGSREQMDVLFEKLQAIL